MTADIYDREGIPETRNLLAKVKIVGKVVSVLVDLICFSIQFAARQVSPETKEIKFLISNPQRRFQF